jgi:hypothetical protein
VGDRKNFSEGKKERSTERKRNSYREGQINGDSDNWRVGEMKSRKQRWKERR